LRIREQFTKYAVYRRMLVSFLGVLVLTTIALSVALVWSFTRIAVEDVAESSTAMLERSVYALDLTHDQVVRIANGLLDSPVMVEALYSSTVDRLLEYRVNLAINRIRTVYPFVRFIAIYNAESGRYINPEGLTAESERSVIDRAFSQTRTVYVSSFPRWLEFPQLDDRPRERVITFVFSPDVRFLNPPNSRILLHLDVKHLERTIATIGGESGSEVYIVDEEGTIIAGEGESTFMRSVVDTDWWKRIDESARRQSSVLVRTNRGRELFAFARSDDSNQLVVSRRPYRALVHNLLGASRTAIAVALGIAAAAVVGGIVTVHRVYSPLGALVERLREGDAAALPVSSRAVNEFDLLRNEYDRFLARVDRLETTIQGDLDVYAAAYVQSLLLGHRFDSFPSLEIAKEVEGRFDWPAFAVVLVSIDRYRRLGRTQATRDLAAASAAILTATQDLLGGRSKATVVGTADNEIAALLQPQNAQHIVDETLLTELQRTVASSIGVSVSIAVGTVVATRESVHDSLLSARRIMVDRFFGGPGSILDESDIRTRIAQSPVDTEKLAQSVLENVRLSRKQDALRKLGAYAETLCTTGYHTAMSSLQHMVDVLHVEISRLSANGDAPDAEQRRAASVAVAEVDFLEDAITIVRRLLEELMQIDENRHENRKELLLRDLKEIVHDCLDDPALNADMVADKAGISGGYVGRLFRELTGETFGHYVNRLRVEQAAELLRTSPMTVKNVSHTVGIDNEHYFFTLFRKYYGESPGRMHELVDADRRKPLPWRDLGRSTTTASAFFS
jgi:AraC-like DNA-binding protein